MADIDTVDRVSLRQWILEQLVGTHVIEADNTLDDVRRTLWLTRFLRLSTEKLNMPCGSIAADIAKKLESFSPDVAGDVLEGARVHMWEVCFSQSQNFH